MKKKRNASGSIDPIFSFHVVGEHLIRKWERIERIYNVHIRVSARKDSSKSCRLYALNPTQSTAAAAYTSASGVSGANETSDRRETSLVAVLR